MDIGEWNAVGQLELVERGPVEHAGPTSSAADEQLPGRVLEQCVDARCTKEERDPHCSDPALHSDSDYLIVVLHAALVTRQFYQVRQQDRPALQHSWNRQVRLLRWHPWQRWRVRGYNGPRSVHDLN